MINGKRKLNMCDFMHGVYILCWASEDTKSSIFVNEKREKKVRLPTVDGAQLELTDNSKNENIFLVISIRFHL